MSGTRDSIRARQILTALAAAEVTHLIGLPDSVSAPLFLRAGDVGVAVVGVTREGEAMAIASGLWLGGKTPVVCIQNTGLLESGDALRGTASRMGVPLLLLVTYRGYAKLQSSGLQPVTGAPLRETLVRPDVDTAAVFTEPTLTSWGVPFDVCLPDREHAQVSEAFRLARLEERPVALLLPGPLT
jgi:sulfopyruvate decarboxylase subunit alpha